MERRVTSHTEEEEMNQRRRLLTLARKGDQKSIDQLFEFYQVKVFSGDALKKKKLPSFPVLKPSNVSGKVRAKPARTKEKTSKVSLSDSKPKKERRARDSNSQPVTRHRISSAAASHSLTLRCRRDTANADKLSLPWEF